MREILFRGKRLDNGEWVEGWYQPEVEWGRHHFGVSLAYKTEHGWLDDVAVDPATVGQYTGLTDKNGRKIFEGDCINHPLNDVEYLDGAFCVAGDRPLRMMAKHGTVIGNIHDGPELVEGGEG